MVVRRGLLFGLFLICLLASGVLIAQEGIPKNPAEEAVSELGGYSESGYPESYEQYIAASNSLFEREQDSSYLQKSLTGIMADNPFFGAFFYYTQRFFSFFDPLWEYSFGRGFDWDLAFFLHVVLWVVLIILVVYPLGAVFENRLLGFFASVIIASLVGAFGTISYAVSFIEEMFTTFFYFTIGMVLLFLLVVLYIALFKKGQEHSEQKELAQAQETIKAHGRASRKALEEFGEG